MSEETTSTVRRPRRNPFEILWRNAPGRLWTITIGALVVAVLANPITLNITRIFPLANGRPKSGLWLLSALVGIFAVGLLLSRRRLWATKVVMLVTFLTVCLVLVETALRVWPPYEVSGVRAWNLASYTDNSWGFADTEPNFEARNRVMVFGDSITYGFGDGLDQRNRFHDLVERDLKADGFDVDIQSLAIGDTQYDVYLEHYRLHAPQYDPQVVVIAWCLNDLDYGEYDRHTGVPPAKSSAKGVWRDLLRDFARKTKVNECFLWTIATHRVSVFARERGWIEADWLDEHNRAYQELVAESYTDPPRLAQARRDLRWLADDCRKKDRELVVLVWPFEFNIAEERRDGLDVMFSMLEEEGIDAVDVYDAYVEAAAEQVIYTYKDACHPNDIGHRIAGTILLDAIRPFMKK